METLHLFADDISASQSWELLDWCLSHGASEFTIDLVGFADAPAPLCDEFEAVFRPYHLPDGAREHLTAPVREEWIRPTQLWRLCSESQLLLQDYLKDGLFTEPSYAEEGWFEGPTFYRQGSLMLGVVSHEREGVALVTTAEALQVQALGIRTRPRAEWI